MAEASTYVFVVLCALASVSIALPGGPADTYCVDLTTGKTSVLPGDTTNVWWTKKPILDGGRCNLQGVLRIKPPSWAKSVSFHMEFELSTNWSVNIGDSRLNSGLRGETVTGTYEADIRGYNKYLNVARGDVTGATLKMHYPAIKTAMLIRLSKQQMSVTNFYGYNIYRQDKGLFAFDTMYMGLNRVVKHAYGSPFRGRTGRCLCSVCIYFLKDTVRDLFNKPVLRPRPPPPPAYHIYHNVPLVPTPVDQRDKSRYPR